MNECLIVSTLANEYAAELANCDGVDIATRLCTSSEEALQQYSGQKIVFGDPDLVAPALQDMPAVEWVQSTWTGIRPFIHVDRRDYILTNVKEVFGAQMSEYVMGHLLAHELRLFERRKQQSKRHWYQKPSGSLAGKCLGIMGTGSIGQHIAHSAATFGMRVNGLSLSGSAAAGFDSVAPVSELHAFLKTTDYLVAALPQTDNTDNLLDNRAFRQLPAHAYFINVGRSNVVDNAALINALSYGMLAGAALDVFDEEPLRQESALWTAPNLLITAHTAALSHPALVVPVFVANLHRYQQSLDLDHVVDFEAGY
jgi:phosphoglycerate dehydrogenase-like enzyme